MSKDHHTVGNSLLHYTIMKYIIENGYAPDLIQLSEMLHVNKQMVIDSLYELQEDHGVVLHPHKPEIWVIHPFSLAPTNFYVKSSKGEWWGNCAWCSLGIAALLDDDVTISTSIGAQGEKIDIHIKNGEVVETDLLIHFPILMKNAWDNVIYTCSTMLIFENVDQINHWCATHHIKMGDVQPLSKIWEFSRVWYGNHLDPDWKKWTTEEAIEKFKRFNLDGESGAYLFLN